MTPPDPPDSRLGQLLRLYRTPAPPESAPPTLPRDLYRIRDASLRTGVAPSTMYRAFRAGKLTLYGRPGYFHVSLSELLPATRRAPRPQEATHANGTGDARRGRVPEQGGSPAPPKAGG